MRYFLAIVLPPLAVFSCGRPLAGLLNLVLTLIFWIPGVIHAVLVVHRFYADARHLAQMQMLKQPAHQPHRARRVVVRGPSPVPRVSTEVEE